MGEYEINPSTLDDIPGKLNDRKTPLGELNWIFTAITDTIAWTTLPPGLDIFYPIFCFLTAISKDLFQKLFRQDMMVASLFRNFLLAERIMRSLKRTPISWPKIPSTSQHPLW